MGAPAGNSNAKDGRAFAGALRRVLNEAKGERERLLVIADQLVSKAEEGDLHAIKEVADRLDGKAAQSLVGPNDGPLLIEQIIRRIVDPKA